MPFSKGNQLAKGKHHKRTAGTSANTPKTIWLLQSLAENGVNLQDLMAKSLIKASKGDKQALELSHLLAKFLPHIANAPKTDSGVLQIETLVINRFDKAAAKKDISNVVLPNVIDSTVISEGEVVEGYPPEGRSYPPLIDSSDNLPS